MKLLTLDINSDGCTHAPDHLQGYKALEQAMGDDFGYRNYKHHQHDEEKQREARRKLAAGLVESGSQYEKNYKECQELREEDEKMEERVGGWIREHPQERCCWQKE